VKAANGMNDAGGRQIENAQVDDDEKKMMICGEGH
jgi:hypothetical protein